MNANLLREKHGGAFTDLANVRLWLRMLSLTTVIEKRLRRAFAKSFATTLPRFDVMAALDRHPDGMRMSALSRELLVSNGNVTALVRGLKRDGLIETDKVPGDGRGAIVRLTGPGRDLFDRMAAAHRAWIDAMLGDVDADRRETLYSLLATLKASVARMDPLDQETDR